MVRGVFVVVVRVVFVVVCCCGSCWWCGCWFGPPCACRRTPLHRTPSAGPPPPDLQNFRAFFPSPATNFALFCLSLCVCSLNFGGFCEDRDPASGPPGFHTTSRELQTCTFDGPALPKTHQKTTRKHPERDKKERK